MFERLRDWLRGTDAPHLMGGPMDFKGAITTQTSVAATTVVGLVLAANRNRRTAILVNTSTTITITLGNATTAAGAGIVLSPGATWIDTDTTGAWYCVAASTTAVIGVVELS